ncbi:TPA: hypothetical protein ACIVP0_004237, partial [Salmonella enterica subsp. diarizonae serovar 61:l,v:z35]
MNGIAVSFQDKITFPLRVIFHHCQPEGGDCHKRSLACLLQTSSRQRQVRRSNFETFNWMDY